MQKHYRHLRLEQCHIISTLRKLGMNHKEIA